jgi:hypothetical protein
MLGDVLGRTTSLPIAMSTDHDPLFEFHHWKANLRILEIDEVKTVPDVPISHPFVERLIRTIRRDLLDYAPFRTKRDLELKLSDFAEYYSRERAHRAIGGQTRHPFSKTACVTPLNSVAEPLPRALSTPRRGLRANSHPTGQLTRSRDVLPVSIAHYDPIRHGRE